MGGKSKRMVREKKGTPLSSRRKEKGGIVSFDVRWPRNTLRSRKERGRRAATPHQSLHAEKEKEPGVSGKGRGVLRDNEET